MMMSSRFWDKFGTLDTLSYDITGRVNLRGRVFEIIDSLITRVAVEKTSPSA